MRARFSCQIDKWVEQGVAVYAPQVARPQNADVGGIQMKRVLIKTLLVACGIHFVAQSWTFMISLDDSWTYTHDSRREYICRINNTAFGVLAIPLNPWNIFKGPRGIQFMDYVCKDHGVPPAFIFLPLFAANSIIWGFCISGIIYLLYRKRNPSLQQGGPGYPPQGVGSPDP